MEPNLETISTEIVETSTEAPTVAPEKPKKSKGLIATIVILSILAVAAIAATVYFYLDASNKAAANSELQAKLDLLKTETGAELIETTENGTTTATVEIAESQSKGGPYIKEGYFYVPEWGWKFKIPTDLASLGYSVDYDEAHIGYDLPFIGFTAVQKSDLTQGAQDAYYDDILSCSIIEVNKTLKSSDNYTPYTLNSDSLETDEYVLRISDYSSGYCELNLNTKQVYEKLKTMFQNPENI